MEISNLKTNRIVLAIIYSSQQRKSGGTYIWSRTRSTNDSCDNIMAFFSTILFGSRELVHLIWILRHITFLRTPHSLANLFVSILGSQNGKAVPFSRLTWFKSVDKGTPRTPILRHKLFPEFQQPLPKVSLLMLINTRGLADKPLIFLVFYEYLVPYKTLAMYELYNCQTSSLFWSCDSPDQHYRQGKHEQQATAHGNAEQSMHICQKY